MQYIAFAPHALHILILYHTYANTLDCNELELKEHLKQAQTKDTNLDPEQVKSQCI